MIMNTNCIIFLDLLKYNFVVVISTRRFDTHVITVCRTAIAAPQSKFGDRNALYRQ